MCQIHSEVLKHVLQRGGVVISGQFYHLKFIRFRSFRGKKRSFGNLGSKARGGTPIPKIKCKNIGKILTFLLKPKIFLKCKINNNSFFNKGFPKGGMGKGRHLGKIPK